MSKGLQGPIRTTGWAFHLLVHRRVGSGSASLCFSVLLAILTILGLECSSGSSFAQYDGAEHHDGAPAADDHGHNHHGQSDPGGWEGSKEGVAYSEFNHHLAGLFVLLIGFSELAQALRLVSVRWARMLLPSALLGTAGFLLVWSDHEAWPIGPMAFSETFFGSDHEILQHKLYGLLSLLVGTIEVLRRLDRLSHVTWMIPLPLFAMIGGAMLFGHSHGAHPSAEKIAFHHAVMGTLAVSAGSSRLVSGWTPSFLGLSRLRWEMIWAGLIFLIGIQLLFYSE